MKAKKMKLFSVIIPVYNVAPYLSRAIESVLRQEYARESEIILIDDGSTDDSGKICDEYAANHSNIHTIHQSNSGQAVARNAGLDVASGEYIVFLDSDDWFENGIFLKFHDILIHNPVDILGYSYRERDEANRILREWKLEYASEKTVFIEDFLKDQYFLPSACLYAYRRGLIEDQRLRFVAGIYHEDEEFVARVMCHARTGIFLNYHPYNYFQRPGSTMLSREIGHLQKRILDSSIVVEKFSEFLTELKDNPTKFAYIQDQINIVNYRIFLNLIAPTFGYRWAKGIYDKMRVRRFVPLRRGRPGRQYWIYRWLTLLHFPFWGFRLFYRCVMLTSSFRKKF